MRRLLLAGAPTPALPLLVRLARECRQAGWDAAFIAPASWRAARTLFRAGEDVDPDGSGDPAAVPVEALAGALAYEHALAEVDPRVTAGSAARVERGLRAAGAVVAAALDAAAVERVVVWNGQVGAGAVAAALARARGVPVLHLENGWFPGTVQAGYGGVNARSGIGAWSDEALRGEARAIRAARRGAALPGTPGGGADDDEAWETPAGGEALTPLAAGRPATDRALRWLEEGPVTAARFRSAAGRWRNGRGRERAGDGWGRGPRPWSDRGTDEARAERAGSEVSLPPGGHALLALQVPTDTQILLHGRAGTRSGALIRAVGDAVGAAFGGAVSLAVRPHPADPLGDEAAREAVVAGAVVAGGPLAEWIERARAVVVVNSTVGVEALVRGRGVVAVGEAAWARSGVAVEAALGPDLAGALVRAAEEGPGPLAGPWLAVARRRFSVVGSRDRVWAATFPDLLGALERGRDPDPPGPAP